MRVLFLSSLAPFPVTDGDRIRTAGLLRRLGRHAEVDFLGFRGVGDDADATHEALRGVVRRIDFVPRPRFGMFRAASSAATLTPNFVARFRSKEMARAVREAVASGGHDVLHVDGLPMVQYVGALPRPMPAVLDMRDAWSVLYRRLLSRSRGWRRAAQHVKVRAIERYERSVVQSGLPLVLLSGDDRAQLQDRWGATGRIDLVPNGVDAEYFSAQPGDGEEDTLVFVGAMGYAPNVEAIRWFVRDVLPGIHARRPGVRLLVVGRDPAPEVLALRGPQVEVTGAVDDVRPYVARARVVVCPILSGAGIKNKVLEAMASARTVVGTPVAFEGIGCRAGEHVLEAADAGAFGEQVVTALEQRELRQALARNGRAFVEAHFSWEASVQALCHVYQDLVSAGAPGRGGVRS